MAILKGEVGSAQGCHENDHSGHGPVDAAGDRYHSHHGEDVQAGPQSHQAISARPGPVVPMPVTSLGSRQAVTTSRRPGLVWATAGVLLFLGLSAVAGGVALTFGVPQSARPPDAWLDSLPLIDTWLIPGLVLGLGFGFGSLIAAYGVLRQPEWGPLAFMQQGTGRHWSWAATIALGCGQIIWIALELFFLPELSFLEVLYGGVGVALVLLPLTATVRRHLGLHGR